MYIRVDNADVIPVYVYRMYVCVCTRRYVYT